MAKREFQQGDRVKLIITKNGDLTFQNQVYTVIKNLDKNSLKVADPDGIPLNVHKSLVIGEEEEQGIQDNHKEEAEMEEKEKEEQKEQKEKKESKEKVIPFDLKAWIKENGGVALVKQCKFDHASHQLFAYVCINAETGYYMTLNVYKYPDGQYGLGKKEVAPGKYPLKGKKINKRVKGVGGKIETVPVKGSETPEQLVARYEKKGYSKV